MTTSEKRKTAYTKYNQSEKGKAASKKYKQSEKGKTANKRAWAKRNQSTKGKAYQKEYAQTEKGKAAYKKYRQSEKGKAGQKKHRQTEKRKISNARAKSNRRSHEKNVTNDLTVTQWEQILKDQNNICTGCNRLFTEKLPPEKEHIIPLTKGGGLTLGNVQAMCKNCNSSKFNKTMDEWETWKSNVTDA